MITDANGTPLAVILTAANAHDVTQLLPLSPVVDLVRLGLTGQAPGGDTVGFADSWAEAALPAVIAVAWIGIGVWAVRRWFRWEPRG